MELSTKKVALVFSIFLLFAVSAIGGAYYVKNRPVSSSEPTGPPAPAAPLQQSEVSSAEPSGAIEPIRLLATGDMIAHDSINANAKKSGNEYDYAALMSDMKQYFDEGDVNFCNQSTPGGGEAFGISGYPVFNAPIAFPRGIEAIGCNLINIGTNHTNDKGKALVDATVAAWDEREVLAVAGANRSEKEQAQPRLFEVKGVTFAFVAYTDYTNKPLTNSFGVNRYSKQIAKVQLDAVRDQADVVIASVRWGTEYSAKINARQDTIAQELADLGVDVVLGHGPHHMQPVKKLVASDKREVYVWYSLGNFLNSQLDPETLIGGFASMDIDPATKKITDVGFMPVYQHYEWTPAQKAAGNLLARKNFKMVPLDQASQLLQKSQLGTTVKAQTDRVKKLLNTYTEVPLISSADF